MPGAKDVALERTSGLPQITVRYNRQKLAQYGLDVERLNQYVSMAFAGASAGEVFENEKRFDMVVRLNVRNRQSIDDLGKLYIDTPSGQQIPLSEVADISYRRSDADLARQSLAPHLCRSERARP